MGLHALQTRGYDLNAMADATGVRITGLSATRGRAPQALAKACG